MSVTIDSVVVAARDQVSADLRGEAVVLSLGKNEYYGLDEVGAKIWELLREPRRVSDIRDVVMQEYEVDSDTCERDLIEFLERLQLEGLLEVTPS